MAEKSSVKAEEIVALSKTEGFLAKQLYVVFTTPADGIGPVIRASSLADAKQIMGRDPMHKSGARKFKIRPWFVNEGTISVRLNYSQGTFEMI